MLSTLKTILPSVLEAGEEVLKIYNNPFSVTYKQKDDPLTQADLKANEIISSSIQKHFPDHFLLSEEEKEKPNRQIKEFLWLLDPIDGTREFVKKNNQFAISLGLSLHGKIQLGIVLNPSTDELFIGIIGMGLISTSFSHPNLTNWTTPLLTKTSNPKPICIVSNTEYKEGLYDHTFWKENYDVRPIGSIAYKLGLVSRAKADLCISLKPKSDWDIGGGIALVESAGGICQTIKGWKPFVFQEDSIQKEGIVAGRIEIVNSLIQSYGSKIESSYRSSY